MAKQRMTKAMFSAAIALAAAASGALYGADAAPLKLQKDDHVAIVGNTLADRMQHSGYFEALVYKAQPQNNLTFRDLGFSADEITVRPRSEDFGTPDDWLRKTQADVVFGFFGFNESFGGAEGLDKFKSDLDQYITDLKKDDFSGRGAVRFVLFSPIALEKLADPNYPDPTKNNERIKLYTAAMAEIAKKEGILFVDLYTPTEQLYKDAKAPLTIDGIHLNDAGYKALAPIMFKAVFGVDAPAIDDSVEKIRQAVLEKNNMWFSRYRTVDGYNVYGGRSHMAYNSGKGGPKVTNREIMQAEMTQRDVMTADRDKRIWAVSNGGDLEIKDEDLPPVKQIKTNDPGTNPDGSFVYPSGEEAIKGMTVPKHVKVTLWADEKQFPELVNPVQMAWDTKGRLWVSAWKNYPERTPTDKTGDSILILEDTKGTGHADKVTHFIDGLNCPTGFQFYKDGILLMEAPDLWYVTGASAGKATSIERVIDGMDSADSHHTTNSMVLDPGGATYLSDGVFHRTSVETAEGPVRNTDAAIYRFEPRTGKFERYVAYGFANPHGRVFDYWGNDIITDATGNASYFAPAFSGHIDYPAKHPAMEQFWKRPSRPCPGTGILSSRAWPDDFNGNFLNCNVIGMQGIFRVKVTEDGSGLKGETLENLVSSEDPTFRPCQVDVAPDGSVFFADWSQALIGHLQHHLRDPNRDHEHGRIYRMVYEGMPLLTPPKIDGQPVEALLDLLKTPENDTRIRAKIELGKHDSGEVIAATNKWVAALDKNDKDYAHNLTEALWVHQWHNVVDVDLLKQVLRSPDFHARAAATRVLCYWRDRVPGALDLLKVQADDESPRVRLEAVRAASFFNGDDVKPAILVADEILKQSTDYYLDYTFKETQKQLQSLIKGSVLPEEPHALAYVLAHMSDAELEKAPDIEGVFLERIQRRNLDISKRFIALKGLADLKKATPEAQFVSVLHWLDEKGPSGAGAAEDFGKALGSLSSDELPKNRAALDELAAQAAQPGVRRLAWAAVITADGSPDKAWAEAKTDAEKQSVLESSGLIYDSTLREKFQPLLTSTLADAKTSPQMHAAALSVLPLMGTSYAKANFAVVAADLENGVDRSAAARALMQLPRDSWDKSAAGPIAQSVLAWAKSVPSDQRTSEDFVETLQAGLEMAGLLPSDEGSKIRKELRGLSVSVFVVKTVREQMRYDNPRLVVEAGKPFEVIFENDDFMPHNLVVVMPGTRQAVAESVANMKPDHLDKEGRQYVPTKDKRVLDATHLLEPGQKETLQMSAPRKEGDYEFVCTFPGHWMMMTGKLVVTRDVDKYLETHPLMLTPTGQPIMSDAQTKQQK